jgi:hypothetical protein
MIAKPINVESSFTVRPARGAARRPQRFPSRIGFVHKVCVHKVCTKRAQRRHAKPIRDANRLCAAWFCGRAAA